MLAKRIIAGFCYSVIIMLIVFTGAYLWRLHGETVSSSVDVSIQNDTVSIIWKPPFQMDACLLFRYDARTEKYFSCGEYLGQTIIIDDVTAGEKIKLRLRAVNYKKVFGHKIPILGFSRELTIMPVEFGQIALDISTNPENRTVRVKWNTVRGDCYKVYLRDDYGKWQEYAQINENVITFDFNDRFSLTDRNYPVKVAVRAIWHEEDYTLFGPMSDPAVIERADLLENKLSLEWKQIGERQYVLKWQECGEEWYEIQQWSQKEKCWMSECIIQRGENMIYQTGHLPSGRQVCFRVISYDNIKKRDREEFEIEPSEVTFHTELSPLYCTIWPIIPLNIIDSPESKNILGEIPEGQAFCVLEERDGYFKILYKDCIGFVDSSFCMINLPEYLGDLCDYNITSSIHAMSSVHGYDIPGVTGNVIRGYENIYLGRDEYLVPYLYPCTKKLCMAVSNAARDGYRFRIYDAFRPNEATRYLYDTTEAVIDYPIADENINMSEESGVTLREIMTGMGKYRLSSFLAASVSAHNRGIALDLTMIDLDTNEELEMQSEIHDLSWHSSIEQNNDNARLLAKYMKEVGYNDLFSEWWHFQDDETKEKIGLKSYLKEGVSIEGWKKDDTGWRYQLRDGSFYEDTVEEINGTDYTFNADGYCKEQNFE